LDDQSPCRPLHRGHLYDELIRRGVISWKPASQVRYRRSSAAPVPVQLGTELLDRAPYSDQQLA